MSSNCVAQLFHSLARLVPPPLVDLSLAHASALGNLNDLLARPQKVAASELILETSKLLLSLSLPLVAAALLSSELRRLLGLITIDLVGLWHALVFGGARGCSRALTHMGCI